MYLVPPGLSRSPYHSGSLYLCMCHTREETFSRIFVCFSFTYRSFSTKKKIILFSLHWDNNALPYNCLSILTGRFKVHEGVKTLKSLITRGDQFLKIDAEKNSIQGLVWLTDATVSWFGPSPFSLPVLLFLYSPYPSRASHSPFFPSTSTRVFVHRGPRSGLSVWDELVVYSGQGLSSPSRWV